MRIADHAHHVIRRCPFAQLQLEPLSQPLDGWFALERWQFRTEHEVRRVDELVGVRPDGEERLDGEFGKHFVTRRIASAHDCNHLVVELERVGLELDPARPDVKEEAKV